jgi:hypothetical protein
LFYSFYFIIYFILLIYYFINLSFLFYLNFSVNFSLIGAPKGP